MVDRRRVGRSSLLCKLMLALRIHDQRLDLHDIPALQADGEALVRVAFNKSPAVLAEGRRRLASVQRNSPTEVEPREPE